MLIINGHQVELEVKLFAKEATRVPDFCVKGETGAFSRYTKTKKTNKRHKSGDQKKELKMKRFFHLFCFVTLPTFHFPPNRLPAGSWQISTFSLLRRQGWS